jgi:hypothetical protein
MSVTDIKKESRMGYSNVGNILVYGWIFNESYVAKHLGIKCESPGDWESYYCEMQCSEKLYGEREDYDSAIYSDEIEIGCWGVETDDQGDGIPEAKPYLALYTEPVSGWFDSEINPRKMIEKEDKVKNNISLLKKWATDKGLELPYEDPQWHVLDYTSYF